MHVKRGPPGAAYIPAMKLATKPETRSFYAGVVQRVIDRIAGDLDQALDLATLASSANLSPFHFHRVFRGMVGETPVELTRRLRIERAAWSLVHTERAVTQIAFDAGYETHEAFPARSAPAMARRRRASRHRWDPGSRRTPASARTGSYRRCSAR